MRDRKYKPPASYTTRNMPGCHGQKPKSYASTVFFLMAVGLLVPVVRTINAGLDMRQMPLILTGCLGVAILLILSLCMKK